MEFEYVIKKGLLEDAEYIREKVFIEEQGFQNEFDEIDNEAFHLVLYCNKIAAATGRLYKKDMEQKVFTIGRIAVLSEYRKLHLGNQLLKLLEEKAKEEGATKIELSAQSQVQGFYEKNGYVAIGEIYYDEFCPHIHMEKIIVS